MCPQPLDDGPPVAEETPRHRRDVRIENLLPASGSVLRPLGERQEITYPWDGFSNRPGRITNPAHGYAFFSPLALAAILARPAMRCDRWGACREGPRSSRIRWPQQGARLPGVVLIVVRHLRQYTGNPRVAPKMWARRIADTPERERRMIHRDVQSQEYLHGCLAGLGFWPSCFSRHAACSWVVVHPQEEKVVLIWGPCGRCCPGPG